MFENREDAGKKLTQMLTRFKNDPSAVIVAIPRGGVMTGCIMAKQLNLSLELSLVKKIGHPSNSEYAIGAVGLTNEVIKNEAGVDSEFIETEIQRIRRILEERKKLFYGNEEPISFLNKTVILVDDGVATGNTLLASVDMIRQEKPKQIIAAVPVGPKDTIDEIREVVDNIICIEIPSPFYAIGEFYQNFTQVSDEQAITLFKNSRATSQY